ncbi:MAG: hypothetical protein JSV29_07125, partial [Candidatus Bathyarchaeota archaeon]
MNASETTIRASFRRIIENSFGEPLEELKKKSPEEILSLIRTRGEGKSSLFPNEKLDYGLNSETDHLKAVLVHRPGPEI